VCVCVCVCVSVNNLPKVAILAVERPEVELATSQVASQRLGPLHEQNTSATTEFNPY